MGPGLVESGAGAGSALPGAFSAAPVSATSLVGALSCGVDSAFGAGGPVCAVRSFCGAFVSLASGGRFGRIGYGGRALIRSLGFGRPARGSTTSGGGSLPGNFETAGWSDAFPEMAFGKSCRPVLEPDCEYMIAPE